MHSLAILFVVTSFLCLLPQPSAYGQSKERAAKKACLTGNPEKGVAILADLFIDSNDITHIFNQGRCFEQNRRYEDAIGRFREYLIKGKNLKAEEKAEAEKHIAACQSYLGKSEPREPVVAEEPKQLPSKVEPAAHPKPVIKEETPAITVRPEPQKAEAGVGLRIAGFTIGAVGVAGLVTGLIFNLKANSMASDLGKTENYSRATDSTRKDYKTLSMIGYGVGAACIAGGAVIYYLGWRKGQDAMPTVAVSPAVSNDMVGTMISGAF